MKYKETNIKQVFLAQPKKKVWKALIAMHMMIKPYR